jgi:hypothetical protein
VLVFSFLPTICRPCKKNAPHKPFKQSDGGGLLNGTNNKTFQGINLLSYTPCRSMAYADYSSTIARLHYHSGRQCLKNHFLSHKIQCKTEAVLPKSNKKEENSIVRKKIRLSWKNVMVVFFHCIVNFEIISRKFLLSPPKLY